MFSLSCLNMSRLVSAYFLSQNTIHSTSPTLSMRSAEQTLTLDPFGTIFSRNIIAWNYFVSKLKLNYKLDETIFYFCTDEAVLEKPSQTIPIKSVHLLLPQRTKPLFHLSKKVKVQFTPLNYHKSLDFQPLKLNNCRDWASLALLVVFYFIKN